MDSDREESELNHLFQRFAWADAARTEQLKRWYADGEAAVSTANTASVASTPSPTKRAKTAAFSPSPSLVRTLTPSTEEVGAFRLRFAAVRKEHPSLPVATLVARVLEEFHAAAEDLKAADLEASAAAKRTARFTEKMSTIGAATRSDFAQLAQHLPTGEANPAWLAARRHRVTGSAVAALANISPYETRAEKTEAMLR